MIVHEWPQGVSTEELREGTPVEEASLSNFPADFLIDFLPSSFPQAKLVKNLANRVIVLRRDMTTLFKFIKIINIEHLIEQHTE